MLEFYKKSPVIIFGMHRSGTTIVGDILERHGLFLGSQKDINGESILHQSLNAWIMRSAGARWDTPMAMRYLWKERDIFDLTRRYIKAAVSGPHKIRYTGLLPYWGLNSGRSRNYRAWGWKDPRNTFTLPLWEALYPDARFIYVERHGADVAKSLVVRNLRELNTYRVKERSLRDQYGPIKSGGFSGSIRCSSLDGALSLWKEYVYQGREHVKRIGADRVMCIRFEELCEAPHSVIGDALEFLGIGSRQNVMNGTLEKISPMRSLAHLRDPSLKEFAVDNERLIDSILKTPYFDGV